MMPLQGDLTIDVPAAFASRREMLRIAYIGPAANTSLQRARAMERLGHDVAIIDPANFMPASALLSRWLFHAGGAGIGHLINRPIAAAVQRHRPDLVWVDQGAYLDPKLIKMLHRGNALVVNYAVDDPFGDRDRMRFAHYRRAVPFYHLLVVVRDQNIAEAYRHGARDVLKMVRCADEVAHRPRNITEEDRRQWGSQVCFAGHCFPERGAFMARLIKAGVPLAIWGNGWHKSDDWPIIAPHWRGPAQLEPDAYAKIIQTAEICLGMVSLGNRDQSTTRSIEIPALGGLFCAARTPEHQALYLEDSEAVFWSSVEECSRRCEELLMQPERMKRLRERGAQRVRASGHFNETMIARVIAASAATVTSR